MTHTHTHTHTRTQKRHRRHADGSCSEQDDGGVSRTAGKARTGCKMHRTPSLYTSLSAKEPYICWLFLWTTTCNLRHPMHLRYLVVPFCKNFSRSLLKVLRSLLLESLKLFFEGSWVSFVGLIDTFPAVGWLRSVGSIKL